jgi:hypothetical protein
MWFGLLAVVFSVPVFLTGGCTPPGENLVTRGQVLVDKQSSGSVRISRADVYQDGENLVVDGSLYNSGLHRQRSKGHTDIAVLSPDGTMLAQKSFRDSWQSHSHGRTYFTTRMPLTPPKGSTIRVLFHDSRTVPASGHTPEEWAALWKAAPKT